MCIQVQNRHWDIFLFTKDIFFIKLLYKKILFYVKVMQVHFVRSLMLQNIHPLYRELDHTQDITDPSNVQLDNFTRANYNQEAAQSEPFKSIGTKLQSRYSRLRVAGVRGSF